MQMARESQQYAPTFFTGFLKNSQRIYDRKKCQNLSRIFPMSFINIKHTMQNRKIWLLLGVGGKQERCRRLYLSWRYELYSRIVGIASSHHKINLYITTEFRGGIQRQNFKKNVLSSTVKNTMQRLRTWMKRQGPSNGCHSSLSHWAGVNWPNVRFTWCRRTIKKITRFTLSPLSNQ